jgi:hypothetical protein
MRTVRLRGWTIGVAVLLCLPAYSAEAPERPYEWTCKAESSFGMTATADGKAHPSFESLEEAANPIRITIRRRSDEAWQQAMRAPSMPDFYAPQRR